MKTCFQFRFGVVLAVRPHGPIPRRFSPAANRATSFDERQIYEKMVKVYNMDTGKVSMIPSPELGHSTRDKVDL